MDNANYYTMIKDLEAEILALKEAQPLPGSFAGFNYFYASQTQNGIMHFRITYESSSPSMCIVTTLYTYTLLPQNGKTQDLYVSPLFGSLVAMGIFTTTPIESVEIV